MPAKRNSSTAAGRGGAAVRVLWSTADWARAVAELPVEGPLPTATVVVPNERAAHVLRRELLRLGQGDRLPGIRFVSPFTAAREILAAAGVEFSAGEEALRPLRIRRLIGTRSRMRYFDAVQLRSMPGWDEAFARTITEMEGAGWSADDLARSGDKRAADIGAIWSEIDASAGTSWSAARILREATARLSRANPVHGPVLAAVTGHETAVHAAFVRAQLQLALAVFGARPIRENHVRRVERLFGSAAAAALLEAQPPRDGSADHDRLAAYLFEPSEVAAQAKRPARLDETVSIERHAGVEDELEAAADWVAREILEHRTPLEEIAVLLPSLDPLAGMLADRLARLPWKGGPLPVCVQSGLPATGTAAGARILAVLRALGEFLPADRVAAVLPWLGIEDEDRHLSASDATELTYALGTPGGSVADPRGSLDWKARLAERQKALEARSNGNGGKADAEHRMERWKRERILRNIRAVRGAFEALVSLAERVVRGAPLRDLRAPLAEFFAQQLRLPVVGDVSLSSLVMRNVEDACGDRVVAELRGTEALDFVTSSLESLRLRAARFGGPAVYVGTIAGAAALPFRAVRILGLAEGHFPTAERADPVLDAERRRMVRRDAVESSDRTLAQFHAFYRTVRNTAERIVLSVPRTDANGTEREPSALLVDVAAAVAPAQKGRDRPEGVVLGMAEIERLWFAPARERRRAWRLAQPIADAAAADLVARTAAAESTRAGQAKKPGALVVPVGWTGSAELDIGRMLELETQPNQGPMGGFVAPAALLPVIPGTTKETPLSPTALRTLLECPHRFLLSTLMGWEEPTSAPSALGIDSLAFGSLFHGVAESFACEHGAEFGRRKHSLGYWEKRAKEIAKRAFDEFVEQYPLAGPDVRAQQSKRLAGAAASFVDYDWNAGQPRTLHAAELRFGYPEPGGEPKPFEMTLGRNVLYLRGRIDRIDVEGRTTLLRDLKTGNAHPREKKEAGPLPKLDVQIALYGLVAERMAKQWRIPPRIEVAYAYVERHPARERAFREDWAELREAALHWLDIAVRLLAERSFPRTPLGGDCDYCPFTAVCGEAAPGGRMAPRPPAGGAAADFHALRAGE